MNPPKPPPGGLSPQNKNTALRVEARALFLESRWTIEQIHKAFADRGDRVHIVTIRRWSAAEKWSARRDELGRIAARREVDTLRREMREKLPATIKRMDATTETLFGRAAGVLLNQGQFCKACGRGADSDKGTFRVNARDVIALAEFRLRLLGFDDDAASSAPVEQFPELPEEALREAANWFARWEGRVPSVEVDDTTGTVRPRLADTPIPEDDDEDDEPEPGADGDTVGTPE